MNKNFLLSILLILIAATLMHQALAEPTGATIVSNTTQTITPAAAGSSTTAGGSFTTLILNATTQTPRWKAYVGNVSGSVGLRDANNQSIYDWGTTSTGGEVYASRNNSINWAGITCAQNSTIITEQTALNHDYTDVDSINNTFNTTTHREFYVGTTQIVASSCRAIATYVNNAAQTVDENADFQEILLQDDTNITIFTTLLDQDTVGYDGNTYDFQLIVPEDETADPPSTYYFWLELS